MENSLSYIVAIPARYASTRLAGKPLALVNGRPMIEAVCRKALESSASKVVACVDDKRVEEALVSLKQEYARFEVCMTSQNPRSGTERIAEMISLLNLDLDTVVVNVQGDEPLITKDHIDAVASLLISSQADMSTLCAPITQISDVFDPNCVKVVMDQQQNALYFSRAPIPYERDNFTQGNSTKAVNDISVLQHKHYHHIGIYGYKAKTILDYLQKEVADIEACESLEQLRLLHYGMKISVATTDQPPATGVDTAADLARVNQILRVNNI